MHKSQMKLNEQEDSAWSFLETHCPKLAQPNRHHVFIFNMDHRPAPFSVHGNKALAPECSKMVNCVNLWVIPSIQLAQSHLRSLERC